MATTPSVRTACAAASSGRGVSHVPCRAPSRLPPAKAALATVARDVRGDEELCRQVDYVFDPTRRELGPLACEGACVPEGFPAGTYLRNGPNSKFGIGKEHFFDGDGMVHGMAFPPGGGAPTYFNRWVEGVGYKREREAGKKLYEGVLVNDGWAMLAAVLKNIVFQSALDTSGTKDTANTAVVSHAGKVLAVSCRFSPPFGRPFSLPPTGSLL